MDVLIIEDEEIAAEKLAMLIERYDPGIRIVGALDSVKNALRWLSVNPRPDLLFLDIYLSDGLSFEIFQKMEVNVPVIFTTAYNEYAIKAFELNSIDYLLKPIRPDDIRKSLDKFKAVRQEYTRHSQRIDYEQLLNAVVSRQKTYKERFMVRVGEKISSIPTEQIAYFYAVEKLVLLVTHENRQLPVDYTLEELADLLDPRLFFRANRQYVINIRAIEGMYAYSNSRIRVTLRPKEPKELVISNEKVGPFRQWLDR